MGAQKHSLLARCMLCYLCKTEAQGEKHFSGEVAYG